MTKHYPELSWHFEPGQHRRMQTFLADNSRRTVGLRLLDTDWPRAAPIREDLLYLLTDAICAGARPILYEALDCGLIEYRRAVGSRGDYARMHVFIDEIIRVLEHYYNGLRLRAPSVSDWQLQDGRALTIWAETLPEASRGKVKFVIEEPSEAEAEAIRSIIWHVCMRHLPARWFNADG